MAKKKALPTHKKYVEQGKINLINYKSLYRIRHEYPQSYWTALRDLLFPVSKNKNVIEVLFNRPQENTECLVLFGHYSPTDKIDTYVFDYLKALKEIKSDIVFCTTAKKICDEDLQKLKTLCRKVIRRTNIGFDIGSYCTAWQNADQKESYKRIIFTNDTVYGPFFNLNKYIEKFDESNYDMFGMTDSFECTYHIQSYFIGFKTNKETLRFLDTFWERYVFHNVQRILIYKYEFGLTHYAIRDGLNVGAFAPYGRVVKHALAKLEKLGYLSQIIQSNTNPTHFFWRVLIEDFQMPFVKIDLVNYNPNKLPDVENIANIIPGFSQHQDAIFENMKNRGSL